jgi:hypothetical protein
MSFQAKSQTAKHGAQPRQRDEESGTEREVKAHLAQLQDITRQAEEALARARARTGSVEKLNAVLEQADFLVEEAEELLQVWSSHLQTTPTERHLKKFALDKLRRIFEFEKEKVEGLSVRAGQLSDGGNVEVYNVADDESDEGGEEEGLLQSQADAQEVTRAEERLNGMTRIQNQVTEVREIMKDLAGIVVEQGQMITTVESHAERANDDAKAAVAELSKAHALANSSRAAAVKAFFFVLLLCCIVYFAYAKETTVQHETHIGSRTFLGWDSSGASAEPNAGPMARETVASPIGSVTPRDHL